MKKSFCILLTVVMLTHLIGPECIAGNNKYLVQILKKYDLPDSVRESDTPEQFRDKTWRANEELIDYFKAAKKDTKL